MTQLNKLTIEQVEKFAKELREFHPVQGIFALWVEQLADNMRSLEFFSQKYQEEIAKSELFMREIEALKHDLERQMTMANEYMRENEMLKEYIKKWLPEKVDEMLKIASCKQSLDCEHIFDTSMNDHTRRCCKCGQSSKT